MTEAIVQTSMEINMAHLTEDMMEDTTTDITTTLTGTMDTIQTTHTSLYINSLRHQ